MVSPLPLPDWVPWWVHVGILAGLGLFALLLLAMPFSVFGTKARLETIEARLDEIQEEIRRLALRLPEPGIRPGLGPIPGAPPPFTERPPIPPAAQLPARPVVSRPDRTEPRLY